MRIAAIDLGTNSFHLVIADTKPNGSFRVVASEKEMVRLGESGADMKLLTEEAMERGIACLRRFKAIIAARKVKAIRAIATSAIREAENRDIFIRRARAEVGISIDIISGVEEGRLIYLGVLQAVPIFSKRSLVLDIGGGSTEYVVGERGSVKVVASLKLGAIRLTKKFGLAERPSLRAIESARKHIVGELTPISREIRKRKFIVAAGSSGTIQAIASIIAATRTGLTSSQAINVRLNNFKFSYSEVRVVVRKLLSESSAIDRKRIPGLDEKRADIIIAGALILEESMRLLGIKELMVSSYALREGVIYDYIRHLRTDGSAHGKISDVREQSVRHLGEISNYEQTHAEHVAALSLSLFDQTLRLHHLGTDERKYLYYASLLHDIGYHISHTEHHQHSYYIISHADLLGFTNEEIEIIANIARYHRKSHPKLKHEGFARLQSDEHRDLVRKLSAIIRIAEGLDRGNISIIRSVDCRINRNSVEIRLKPKKNAPRDLELEIWGAERKKMLFEEVYGRQVRFVEV
ncbi:MAG: Ppx/GppA phosphatase family protein [Bacteroidota bacterium]|nr:Ppx/GppA phosphatase family protein [Bacteroidota bacterium]MDP4230735.1 Ppx/GppA phosphatase family protein [Bacteroidota bacterium]MDP4236143.1 Ppx/GppA phosphatase family protein [Bacteroidota bacterium]